MISAEHPISCRMNDIHRLIARIKASQLFDADWYSSEYPDVAMLGMEPVEHYAKIGSLLLRAPHPRFDAAWYASHHADIARLGLDPFTHFCAHGRYEGRKTMPVGGSHPTYSLCIDKKGGIDHKYDLWNHEREAQFLQALETACSGSPGRGYAATVVMPTHNRADEIGAAIESVLSQDHQTWELLIVDDGSIDDTQAVVAPLLEDSRIRYVRQPHGGVSKARNTGLQMANCPFVFYLDSDNTWRKDLLGTMLGFMTAGGLDAAYSGSFCYRDAGGGSYYTGDDFSWSECLRENYVDMNAFAHRRELVATHGTFDESLLRLVDWDFILRLTREAKVAYAPFCGVRYYDGRRSDRISHTHYIGTLKTVASNIRAKHPPGFAGPAERLTAEGVLASSIASHPAGASVSPVTSARHAYDRRVGYVVWDWPALSQTFVINEVRALIERGADVVVYCKTAAEKPAELHFEVPVYVVEDAVALAGLVRDHARTVLHSPFVYPTTTLLTWPCSVETGIPFTFMPGGVDISHYENMKRNRVGEIASSSNCLAVITLGSYHREFLIEQGVPAERIVLERQSVELPAFSPRAQSAGRPRVVSIARFVEKKGLASLIDAAASLPSVDVHVYGYGPLEQALREQVQRLGLTNVRIEDPLTSSEGLHEAYARADLFVLPCVRAANGDLDGLPTVILEAMASGVPVVSNQITNIPDVVIDGTTGFLASPGDTGSLVAKMKQALSLDPDARSTLVHNARRLVEDYAGCERTAATLERLWSGSPTEPVHS